MKGWIINIINRLFILLFTYTASSKLYELRKFRFVLHMSPLLKNYSRLLSAGIPVIELGASIALYTSYRQNSNDSRRKPFNTVYCLYHLYDSYRSYPALLLRGRYEREKQNTNTFKNNSYCNKQDVS